MGKQHGYKKYMKKNVQKGSSLWQIFLISFFGMLLVFTYLIKSFSPSVDTSIGEYRQEKKVITPEETKKNVDNRLAIIQDEDQGRNFSDLMANPDDTPREVNAAITRSETAKPASETEASEYEAAQQLEPVYKVFIGTYTSAEQARVAKDIIQESGNGLNPIVKCIGSNNYTLQVGIFKNKQSAESLLYTVQQSNLPGRIIQDY